MKQLVYVGFVGTVLTSVIYAQEVDYQRMLLSGVVYADLEKVKTALENGADINAQYGAMDRTVLHRAVKNFCEDMRELNKIFDKNDEKHELDTTLKFTLIAAICWAYTHYSRVYFEEKLEKCVTKASCMVYGIEFAMEVIIPKFIYSGLAVEILCRTFNLIKGKHTQALSFIKEQKIDARIKIIEYLVDNPHSNLAITDKNGDTPLKIAQKEYEKSDDVYHKLRLVIALLERKV